MACWTQHCLSICITSCPKIGQYDRLRVFLSPNCPTENNLSNICYTQYSHFLHPLEWPLDVKLREPKSGRKQPTRASRTKHATGFGVALCAAHIRHEASHCQGPTYDNTSVAGNAQSTCDNTDNIRTLKASRGGYRSALKEHINDGQAERVMRNRCMAAIMLNRASSNTSGKPEQEF